MNPLTNVLSPKARRIAYAVLFVAALVFSAAQGTKGDWFEVVGGVITALLGATAASNASPTPTGTEPEGVWVEVSRPGHPVSGNEPDNDYGYQNHDPLF